MGHGQGCCLLCQDYAVSQAKSACFSGNSFCRRGYSQPSPLLSRQVRLKTPEGQAVAGRAGLRPVLQALPLGLYVTLRTFFPLSGSQFLHL